MYVIIAVFFLLRVVCASFFVFFFFNDTATTEIYTLSLHDALPISCSLRGAAGDGEGCVDTCANTRRPRRPRTARPARGRHPSPCRGARGCDRRAVAAPPRPAGRH